MRGAFVAGHAGWCHTELGVLGGNWPARDGSRLLQAWDRWRACGEHPAWAAGCTRGSGSQRGWPGTGQAAERL